MNIVVLCGGLSAERDVSISSGTKVALALRGRGHNVALIDVFFGYLGSYVNPMEIFLRNDPIIEQAISETEPDLEKIRASRSQPNDSLIGDNVIDICRAADIVFLALHGDMGENGQLQAVFDIMGVRYTGAGYFGSALAMNKSVSKALFENAGIKTPESITVFRGTAPYRNIGFPCVVKPCSGGSSVGTSIVMTKDEYQNALALAFKYEESVLVEQYIKGRELTVGILGGEPMPVVEIIPKQGFYDYKNKYQDDMTEEICPAEIGAEMTETVQALAVQVHNSLLLESYSRVDMLVDGGGEIYVLEANTLPGMTPLSLVPRMGSAMGLEFGRLCEKIIEVSLEKYK